MLKIFSLNLNGYEPKHGEWPERLALIAENIRACSPDVVALQAVRKESARHSMSQAEQLAEAAGGFKHIFFSAKNKGHGWEQGSALLSRTEFLAQEELELNGENDEDPLIRSVVYARVKTSSAHEVGIFNCHFSWVEAQNRRNIIESIPFFRRHSDDAVIIGDFNTPYDSDSLRQILSAGWLDAWKVLYPDLAQEGFTFESDRPSKRIDFALVPRGLEPSLQDLELVGLENEKENVRMSDHLGLLLTLAR